jgi:hypothetical protein
MPCGPSKRARTWKFSEREQKMLETYWNDFVGAQAAIEKSGYNDAVRAFYRGTLNVFPTKFSG